MWTRGRRPDRVEPDRGRAIGLAVAAGRARRRRGRGRQGPRDHPGPRGPGDRLRRSGGRRPPRSVAAATGRCPRDPPPDRRRRRPGGVADRHQGADRRADPAPDRPADPRGRPEGHITKAGTPTMGGVAIVAGAVVGYLVSDISDSRIYHPVGPARDVGHRRRRAGRLLDDWIKVTRERNLGLTKRAKILGPPGRGHRLRRAGMLSHTHVSTDALVHPLQTVLARARQGRLGACGRCS